MPLSTQQAKELLEGFPSSVEIRLPSRQEQQLEARTGTTMAGLSAETIVTASLILAGGYLAGGFFGEIGKDAWSATKRGIARLLRRINDNQYSTSGSAYIIIVHPVQKIVVLECGLLVRPSDNHILTDDQVESRLIQVLDYYRMNESKIARLLEAVAARSNRPVLAVRMEDGIAVSAHHSLNSLGIPDYYNHLANVDRSQPGFRDSIYAHEKTLDQP